MTREDLQLTDHAALVSLPRESLTVDDVLVVLTTGETIREYPEDRPYPSQLMLGWVAGRPVHVCWALTPAGTARIITAYRPDRRPDLWDDAFRRKVRR